MSNGLMQSSYRDRDRRCSFRTDNSKMKDEIKPVRRNLTNEPLINMRYTRTETDEVIEGRDNHQASTAGTLERFDKIQRSIEESLDGSSHRHAMSLEPHRHYPGSAVHEQYQNRIRELIIRYEDREKLLMLELDNQKRKESYYSQETDSLRKVNESLQEELRIVHHKMQIYEEDHRDTQELVHENGFLREQIEAIQMECERLKNLARNQEQRHLKEINQITRHANSVEQELRRADIKLKQENQRAEVGLQAQRRLSQTQKQSAQLVLQNCSLKKALNEIQLRYEKCQQQLNNFGKDYVSDLQAQILMYQRENSQLQQENSSLASNYYMLEQSFNRLHQRLPEQNMPIQYHRPPVHMRCKTEYEPPVGAIIPKRRPVSRKATLSQSFEKLEYQKERLNDAIVKRCRLTLAPR